MIQRKLGAHRAAAFDLEAACAGFIYALEVAQQIATNSPVAVRAAKRALRSGLGLDYAAAMDVEDAAWRTAAFSADRQEGIAAFNDKRRPDWPGV